MNADDQEAVSMTATDRDCVSGRDQLGKQLHEAIAEARRLLWWFIENDEEQGEVSMRAMDIQDKVLYPAHAVVEGLLVRVAELEQELEGVFERLDEAQTNERAADLALRRITDGTSYGKRNEEFPNVDWQDTLPGESFSLWQSAVARAALNGGQQEVSDE